MDSDSIRRYCLSFRHATEKLQWSDELCFKLRGNIFMKVGLDSVPLRFCFKCAPETFVESVEREGIIPAPYVGRYKWVMVKDPAALRDSELEDLIGQSYHLVAYKVQKQKARQKTRRRRRKKKAKSRKSGV